MAKIASLDLLSPRKGHGDLDVKDSCRVVKQMKMT